MILTLNTLIIICISVGLLFFLAAVIGVFRLPDFYSRLHAAGKGDTLSTFLMLAGCGLYNLSGAHFDSDSIVVMAKLGLIILFLFIGSPTATHAMMDAGYETDIKHWEKKETNS